MATKYIVLRHYPKRTSVAERRRWEMAWRQTRDVMASNWYRNSFRWISGSSYDPPARRTRTVRSRHSGHGNWTGRSSASDGPDNLFRQAIRARKLASAAGTSTVSEVSRQNFLNSADGLDRTSSSAGAQRRGSELVSEQPRPPRSEQRRLVRNGFISPVNIERRRSSVNAAVQAEPDGANSGPLPDSQVLRAENGKRRSSSELANGQRRRLRSSASGSSVTTAVHVDPELPAVRRSSRVRSIPLQVPQESQTESRKRKRPSSVSIEHPGSSSSTQPSSSRSSRSRRSQPTDRNGQVESDEMLARQLQQELFNEMQDIVNVIDTNASIAGQNHTRRRAGGGGGGGGAAAARTNGILQIQQIQRDFNENDYEMLLALDEDNHKHTGAPEGLINCLPQSIIQCADDSPEDPCAICRDTPAVGDVTRHLPCLHKFHKDCIDLWLERKPLCPICKSDVR